jgi:ubiquinone/menaquinone biosynthesis C-methylase UbiE
MNPRYPKHSEQKNNDTFYKDIVTRYETAVTHFVPGYETEMVPAVIQEMARYSQNGRILDIGSGTGNIDVELVNVCTPSSLDLVEIAAPMLEESKRRLSDIYTTVRFHNVSAIEFEAAPSSFDSILSNLVLHNISVEEKKALLQHIYSWLSKGGIFIWTDLITFDDPDTFDSVLKERAEIARSYGETEEMIERNFQKEREEDHMITLKNMTQLLEDVGFDEVTFLWGSYNAATLRAKK